MSVHWVACGRCYSKPKGAELGGIELQRFSQIFSSRGSLRAFKDVHEKFSNIDFFLQILPLKNDELVMSEM